MQITSLHIDCKIDANTAQEADTQIDWLRSRAMAFFADGQTAATPAIKPPRARPARARGRATTTTGGGGRRRVSDDQFHAAVSLLGGASAVAIAEKTGLSHNQALRRLGEMEKAGMVYRTGERSRTRWVAQEVRDAATA